MSALEKQRGGHALCRPSDRPAQNELFSAQHLENPLMLEQIAVV